MGEGPSTPTAQHADRRSDLRPPRPGATAQGIFVVFKEVIMWKPVTRAALGLFAALCTTIALAAVDVNKASEADLDSIKGIGPGTSSKILEQRKAGNFKNWGDFIQRVPGIGEKRAAKLSSEGLTVNGEGFKPAAAAAKPATKN